MSFNDEYQSGIMSMCKIILVSELNDNIEDRIANENNLTIFVRKDSDWVDCPIIFLGKKKYDFGYDELEILEAIDGILDNDLEIAGKKYNVDTKLINLIKKYLAEKGKHLFNYVGLLKIDSIALFKDELEEKYFSEIDLTNHEKVKEVYQIDELNYKMIIAPKFYDTVLVEEYEFKSFFLNKIIKKITMEISIPD